METSLVKVLEFFLLDACKIAFQIRHLIYRWTQPNQGIFPKIRTLFHLLATLAPLLIFPSALFSNLNTRFPI